MLPQIHPEMVKPLLQAYQIHELQSWNIRVYSCVLVTGGGAIEAALSIYLENFATTLESREQLAIAEFANALLIIPKTLAVNAAKDATELIAKLRAYHYTAQTKPEKTQLARYGLDLEQGSIRDNVTAGVLEPVLAKTKIIQVSFLAPTRCLSKCVWKTNQHKLY